MRSALLLLLPLLTFASLKAQFTEVVQGPGYANAVYLDLATHTSEAVDHAAWDIAFATNGRSASILVNEGISSSRSNPQAEVELYLSNATTLAEVDTNSIVERLYNTEVSWDGGAFSTVATPGDPFDNGWGNYDPATQTLAGSRYFLLKTRDGQLHRLFIESLIGGVYTFVHGQVGETTLDTVLVDKQEYSGKTLVYYSFEDGVRDLEPTNWDLLFTRYSTPLDDGNGGTIDYTVTGVLHNRGVTVAELNGVDPQTAPAPTDEAAYSDTLTTIGYDWKDFNLQTYQWTIPTDRAYFVQTPDSLYRLEFLDFTGSSSGTSSISSEGLLQTATTAVTGPNLNSTLYPNPAPGTVSFLEFELSYATPDARLTLLNAAGQLLSQQPARTLQAGTHRLEVSLQGLPAGSYFVRLSGSFGQLTHHLIKQ